MDYVLFDLELPTGSWVLPEVEHSPGFLTEGGVHGRLTEPFLVIIHLQSSAW